MKRWKEYFEKLLYTEQITDLKINLLEWKIWRIMKAQEVTERIKILKRGKVVGHDGITPEMLCLQNKG